MLKTQIMETAQLRAYQVQMPVQPIKESIRDMVRLQRNCQISDELFWEVFNARVLLNEQIDIDKFIIDFNRWPAYA